MRFGVLGPLGVWTDDGVPVRVRDTKVRALLAALLLAEGRMVTVDHLVDVLWGDSPPARPTAVLQARVSQLRGVLDRAEPGARALVRYRAPGYALRADDVDAARFAALVRQARNGSDPCSRADLLTRALDLWRGPVLAEFADTDAVRPAAARWEEARVTAVEDWAEARLELGEYAALAADLAAVVDRHPFRERLHAAFIRALYGAGRQGEALAAYERLRSRLAEELGIDPGADLVALHRSLLKQDPVLTPGPAAHAPTGNLPASVSDLVGREERLPRLVALARERRLVTLTGPGGVGKTRLALAAAARLADTAAVGGAWLVELAPLPADGDPVGVLAAVLGGRDDLGPSPFERVVDLLRGRRALVVLDNCEHVVASVADTVARLLREVPDLTVLATSRVPLDVAGERRFVVPPLDLPPDTDDTEELARSGAVRLFTARARDAVPAFTLDARTASAVAVVCRRLDGIPLALELAATRLRHMGVDELAARLDDRFALLGMGRRDAPARQRTLRATIDWSWEPLPPVERRVLARLAVFADGCDLAAAEAVCADAEGAVLDTVGALADRSLVVVADRPDGTRYHLLESVAAYALDRLEEAGETRRSRLRHALHFADVAERADAALRGSAQRSWLERLDREAANLRAALDTAVREADADLALRLADALCWYRYLRGRTGESRRALDRALALRGGSPGARARARVWRAALADPEDVRLRDEARRTLPIVSGTAARVRLAWFLEMTRWGLGDTDQATRCVRAAHEEAVAAKDPWGAAVTRIQLADAAHQRGDLDVALALAEEGEQDMRALGDRWGLLRAANVSAAVLEALGDLDGVAVRHEEGRRIAEELRLWTVVARALSGLGRVALLRGDLDRAVELLTRARGIAAEHADALGEQFADAGLALVARRSGDLGRAERLLHRWLDWNRRAGSRVGLAFILTQLGYVAEQRGDAELALARHEEAQGAAEESGDPRAVALALEGQAGAYALMGDTERSEKLLSEAEALRERSGAPLTAAERVDVDRIGLRPG
ncbi:BTAD domain-containing putative transcriptional regulator [Nocardiopsis sp. FIRDI 009]|uniref:ATP-binding protein n=1 Tax=Nocardiopsis sp. FIRDI 009 TaxID=714197 RepID=UPI000E232300|nr:BTAD domain-containing putative transcriptional regulator [Nocardiopsis sp. FIRDI 009]